MNRDLWRRMWHCYASDPQGTIDMTSDNSAARDSAAPEPRAVSGRIGLAAAALAVLVGLGFLLAFWATPAMSQGHLLFAIVTSVYIVFGITVEERDLLNFLGDDYRAYRKRTPALIPFLPKGKGD